MFPSVCKLEFDQVDGKSCLSAQLKINKYFIHSSYFYSLYYL